MLCYFYKFDYDDCAGPDDVEPIIRDVRMFAIADKYFIAPLKTLAAEKFAKRAELEWNTDHFANAIAEVCTIVPEHEDALRVQ